MFLMIMINNDVDHLAKIVMSAFFTSQFHQHRTYNSYGKTNAILILEIFMNSRKMSIRTIWWQWSFMLRCARLAWKFMIIEIPCFSWIRKCMKIYDTGITIYLCVPGVKASRGRVMYWHKCNKTLNVMFGINYHALIGTIQLETFTILKWLVYLFK